MTRSATVALVLFWGILAAGSAAAQQDGYYEVQGIHYYYATGVHGSGHMTLGFDPAFSKPEEFQGCGWAKVRPDNNRGRIEVIGDWYGLPYSVDLTHIPNSTAVPDALGPGRDLEAGPGAGTWVTADIGATGTATVSLGGFGILDPVTGSTNLSATWFVTSQGYRDDDTGRMTDQNGGPFEPGGTLGRNGGPEMHLHLRSDPSLPRQKDWSIRVGDPRAPVPYLAPQHGYQSSWSLANQRLMGTGTVAIDASSIAQAGENDFEVRVHAPDESVVAQKKLAPYLGQNAATRLEFGLDTVGSYRVVVAGNISLLAYSMLLTQSAPESFAMDLWWDEVAGGYAGHQAQNECRKIANGERASAYIPEQSEPVSFDWRFSLFTVGAGVTLALVTVGIIVSARGHSRGKQDIRK